jgi:hypothetical protein
MTARSSRRLSLHSDSGARDAVMLAGALVAGVLFLVPVVAWLLRTRGVATETAIVVPLVTVCVAYGLLVYRTGRVPLGLFVAFAVFVTVWAPSLPWGPTPGSLAWATTQNWLAQAALVGLLVCYTWHGWKPREYFSRAHLALGGFVVWTFVSVPFVAGPYPGLAFQFGLYVLQAWAVFAVVSWLAESGRLSLPAATATLATVVVGHAVVGLVEFTEGVSLGLDGASDGVAAVGRLSLGPLGTHPVGPYVNGLVGSSALGSLLAMLAPLLCVLALRAHGPRRFAWAALWLLCAFVIRMTGWDTGRGAFLLGMAVVGIGLAWRYRAEHALSIDPVQVAFATLAAVLGVAVALLPSSATGGAPRFEPIGLTVNPSSWPPLVTDLVGAVVGVARATNATAGAANASAGYGPTYLSPDGVASTVSSLSVPLFDLSGLDVRIQQVVAGIDLFLQYPVFGIGGANFYYVAEAFGLPKLWLHTVYAALLAETGLLGALCYVLALGFVVAAGGRLLATGADHWGGDWLLALGLVAALCAHLGTMLLQPTHMRAQLLLPFWTLCGLLVGTKRRHND